MKIMEVLSSIATVWGATAAPDHPQNSVERHLMASNGWVITLRAKLSLEGDRFRVGATLNAYATGSVDSVDATEAAALMAEASVLLARATSMARRYSWSAAQLKEEERELEAPQPASPPERLAWKPRSTQDKGGPSAKCANCGRLYKEHAIVFDKDDKHWCPTK